MKIDILKIINIINKCNDFSGQDVMLNSSEQNGIITFTFEWNESEGLHSINYTIAKWEIEKFCPDTLDEVLIGKFKFEYKNRFM